MENEEIAHLEIQEGTFSTGEPAWKDAGPIHLLLDNPPFESHHLATFTNQKQALPKQAKEWLISKHSVKTNKDRQNLYLFRNSPENNAPNTNLLLLLHGAGDTHRPFDKLAQTMALPQTATLSINSKTCGGVDLPFGLGHSWFQELDYATGNPLPQTHSMRATTLQHAADFLMELLLQLSTVWAPERIFMLGYGAGATVAMEMCRLWTGPPLGGAICVGMDGLCGKSEVSSVNDSGTPILLLSNDSKLMRECKEEYEVARGGKVLVETHLQAKKGMISGPSEMLVVMKFLSKRLVLATRFPPSATVSYYRLCLGPSFF